jgi:energy-coupling factor transporter ATP-binding protein EcfA2
MQVEERKIKQPTYSKKKNEAPITTHWNKIPMIRNQSVQAAVWEITKMAQSLDVVKVNLVGKPGTGKTTLAKTIAHLIHKQSAPLPFNVRIFTKNELMNFEQTLATLSPTNYILIFDDVSFMNAKNSKKQIEVVKQAFTEIRHLEGGKDVKIVAIFNFHYSLALDKYLRQSEFQFFTSVGSSDMDNTLQLVGHKHLKKVMDFQKMWNQAYAKAKWSFLINAKKQSYFTYDFRAPFIPTLFWNGGNLRHVVSPIREWIDKICPTCNEAENKQTDNKISVPLFIEQLESQFAKTTVKSVVKQMLKEQGINTYSKEYVRARRHLDKSLMVHQISFTDLLLHYDLKETKVTLKGKKIAKSEDIEKKDL